MTVSGSCFGFGVRTDLPLQFLRAGTGDALEIHRAVGPAPESFGQLLTEWTEPSHVRLYADGDRYYLWSASGYSHLVEPEVPRITLFSENGGVRAEQVLWGVPAMLCFMQRGDLPLHAAAIEIAGRAVLLAAPRTWGKTTLAAACQGVGHRLLSEDTTCVRLTPSPSVLPGPAVLRVRIDMAARLGLRHVHEVARDDDRVHFAVDEPRRGDSHPVPLAAIVFLRDGGNGLEVKAADPTEAVRDLWSLSFRVPTQASVSTSFEQIVDLVREVPVLNLSRPIRINSLPETIEALELLREQVAS